jgi:[protein-PII] uridylyltransferase
MTQSTRSSEVSLAEPTSVLAFRESLGSEYASRYDAQTIARHALIAQQRGTQTVSVGVFDFERRPQVGICVVAKDTAGLLATITSAFIACELDIASAEAYTRNLGSNQSEAVDIFWVYSRTGNPQVLEDEELTLLQATLVNLLEGHGDEPSTKPSSESTKPTETMVRFLESEDGTFTTLEVETDDRSGLLQALASALFSAKVQITSSQVRTTGTRVYDRFSIVEVDGSPITAERRLEVQVAVLSAVDPSITL